MMRRSLRLSVWILATVTAAHAAESSSARSGCIGASFTRDKASSFLTIEYVAAQSPAAEAGIKTGDGITAIKGAPVSGMSPAEATRSTEGDIGGVVKLIIRRGESSGEQVSIVRQSVLDSYLLAAKEGDPRAHFQLVYFVPLAGLGLILGWARLKTDSLRFPVFLHLLNNGLFLLLAA